MRNSSSFDNISQNERLAAALGRFATMQVLRKVPYLRQCYVTNREVP